MRTMNKCYSELIKFDSFKERFEYLKLNGIVSDVTFGSKRYLNQEFYKSDKWKRVRRAIIIRDNGCDLGIRGHEIVNHRGIILIIHHINPITIDDILNESSIVFDPENLITTTFRTHNAIHYGDESCIISEPIERRPNDTCPWKR